MVKSVVHKTKPGSQSKSNSNVSKYGCPLCNGNHKVHDCHKYKSTANKLDRVKRLNLCFNCLSSKHQVNVCPSRFVCRNCHSRHHTVLCSQSQTQKATTNSTNPTNKTKVVGCLSRPWRYYRGTFKERLGTFGSVTYLCLVDGFLS